MSAQSSRICISLLLILSFVSLDARAGYPIPITEKLALPTFCYRDVGVEGFTGPEFSIPANCGDGMNHYCTGLWRLNRAKKLSAKSQAAERGWWLGDARADLYYTKQALANYPDCPIRQHVEASVMEADRLWKITQHR